MSDAVAVGQQIPHFVRSTGLANWNRYAAVNDEFVPIHMDDEAGRAAGMPSAFGMGNLQWSFLHNALREWQPDAAILKVSCQFRSPNIKGQVVTAKGTVTDVREKPDGTEVDVDVWTEDQDGNVLAPGKATLRLP